METTRLDKLFINEVSGVDEPANQLPGWMVTKSAESNSESIVAKIKGIVLGHAPGKEDDVEKAEFVEALAEQTDALATAVAEAVAKAVAPTEGATITEAAPAAEAAPAVEAAPALTAEDVAKAVSDAVEAVEKSYNEILEAVLVRVEGIETHLGVAARKSLDGQEANEGTEPVTKSTPDLADAISGAFKR